MKNYASYEEMKELYNKTIPQMAIFEKMMSKYNTDHKKYLEMIKRYDEIIALKANKSSLIDFEKKVYERYAKKDALREMTENHDERLKSLLNDHNRLNTNVSILKTELSNAITGAVEKACRRVEARMYSRSIKETWKSNFS